MVCIGDPLFSDLDVFLFDNLSRLIQSTGFGALGTLELTYAGERSWLFDVLRGNDGTVEDRL